MRGMCVVGLALCSYVPMAALRLLPCSSKVLLPTVHLNMAPALGTTAGHGNMEGIS